MQLTQQVKVQLNEITLYHFFPWRMVLNSFTCPGKMPDTGVEPPEWLGELGRDLQEASKAACFLAAMIFWAAVEEK